MSLEQTIIIAHSAYLFLETAKMCNNAHDHSVVSLAFKSASNGYTLCKQSLGKLEYTYDGVAGVDAFDFACDSGWEWSSWQEFCRKMHVTFMGDLYSLHALVNLYATRGAHRVDLIF